MIVSRTQPTGYESLKRAYGRFRAPRMELFLRLVGPLPKPVKVLDVGGTADFWQGYITDELSVTLLNVFDQRPLVGGMRVIVGDGCDLTQFHDRSFEVVLAHSVLGHVGGWHRQQQMASEIRRVGSRYFVQSPNHRFPVDWRTLVPFFHWLSPAHQAWCLQKVRVGRYARVPDADRAHHLANRIRNVTRSELRELFPGGTIVVERVCGFPKSFVVHQGFDRRSESVGQRITRHR